MSSPLNAILTGSFTSDGLARDIVLPPGVTDFRLINMTDIGSAEAATPVMRAEWSSEMNNGSAYYNLKTSGAATLALEAMTTTNGFSFFDNSAGVANNAPVALSGTEVNQANPAVAGTGSTTGLIDTSSVVRIYGTTGMLQIAGMDFTVGTIVTDTSFQLKYLNSSGFAAAATAGSYVLINADPMYYPRHRFITAITQASSAVITMSVTHGYTVGQVVRVVVPSEFGMTQMNGLLGTVTAINTSTNTITVNIDSSGFTAFAFPTSAIAATGVSFALVVPVGEAAVNTVSQPYANLLDDATNNVSFRGIRIGTTVQTSGKEYQWVALKGLSL